MRVALPGFGADFRLAVATSPAAELSPGETDAFARLGSEARRSSWLLGRAALKSVLADLGESSDTSRLSFPHPRLSLTHCAGTGVALGIPGGAGAGIDLERRAPGREAARRVLAAEGLSGSPDDWLRLWTVKEACFKADLENAGRTVAEYVVEDPTAAEGVLRRGARRFRYGSLRALGGWLTLARALPETGTGP
jgi:4'-phosphopantetheinyl transferase EntD